MNLTDHQVERYARHLILDEVGEAGQEKLLAARVLVVGAGGLGSPLLLYLAAAGIGTLGVVDHDRVDLSNLQRQIAHVTSSIGRSKVDSATETIAAINPEIRVVGHRERLTRTNASALIDGYDIVADGSDNFPTRYLLNDACHLARTPLVSGSLLRFEGQVSTFKPWTGGPCYRCLFPEAPPADLIPRCEQAGILGAVAGVVGTMQAAEVLKEILSLGDSLSGKMLLYDALGPSLRAIRVAKNPNCRLCGDRPTMTDLSHHPDPG